MTERAEHSRRFDTDGEGTTHVEQLFSRRSHMGQHATLPVDSTVHHKPILIVDEARFSRICSAILDLEGFTARSISDAGRQSARLEETDFGLVIMSYPFGVFLFEEVVRLKVPVILMADDLSSSVVRALGHFSRCHCMIKPIDYRELRLLVRQCMGTHADITGGYKGV